MCISIAIFNLYVSQYVFLVIVTWCVTSQFCFVTEKAFNSIQPPTRNATNERR